MEAYQHSNLWWFLKSPETTQTATRNEQLHVKSLKGNIIQPRRLEVLGQQKWAWRTLSSERSQTYMLQIIWTHYTDNSTVYEPVETENCWGGSWTRKDENLEDNEETQLTGGGGGEWQKCSKVMVILIPHSTTHFVERNGVSAIRTNTVSRQTLAPITLTQSERYGWCHRPQERECVFHQGSYLPKHELKPITRRADNQETVLPMACEYKTRECRAPAPSSRGPEWWQNPETQGPLGVVWSIFPLTTFTPKSHIHADHIHTKVSSAQLE